MDRNQQIKTYRRDLLNPLKKPVFTERSVSLSDGGKKCVKASYNFDLRSQIFESVAMEAKKLLADDKRKTWSGETFCFLGKRLLSIFKLCTSNNLLFFL